MVKLMTFEVKDNSDNNPCRFYFMFTEEIISFQELKEKHPVLRHCDEIRFSIIEELHPYMVPCEVLIPSLITPDHVENMFLEEELSQEDFDENEEDED